MTALRRADKRLADLEALAREHSPSEIATRWGLRRNEVLNMLKTIELLKQAGKFRPRKRTPTKHVRAAARG